MPTDDERREVARRIRRIPEKGKAVAFNVLADQLGLEFDPDFMSFSVCTPESVMHLAELIEPEERTCRMIEVETGEVADYSDTDEVIFHCTSCHAERGIFSYDEDGNVYSQRPEYCPNCRAKVVGDDY